MGWDVCENSSASTQKNPLPRVSYQEFVTILEAKGLRCGKRVQMGMATKQLLEDENGNPIGMLELSGIDCQTYSAWAFTKCPNVLFTAWQEAGLAPYLIS